MVIRNSKRGSGRQERRGVYRRCQTAGLSATLPLPDYGRVARHSDGTNDRASVDSAPTGGIPKVHARVKLAKSRHGSARCSRSRNPLSPGWAEDRPSPHDPIGVFRIQKWNLNANWMIRGLLLAEMMRPKLPEFRTRPVVWSMLPPEAIRAFRLLIGLAKFG